MDIIELSQKMEADLLESHSKDSFTLKPPTNDNFSPRITRSQTNKNQKCDNDSHEDIGKLERIIPNKKSKIVHKNLETIYEDPIWKKGNAMLLGTSKVKRSIYLDREFRITSKQKAKLRKIKIKRLGRRIKPFKISDEEFKNRMNRIENFINENDLDSESMNKDCDVEFNNYDNNQTNIKSPENVINEENRFL